MFVEQWKAVSTRIRALTEAATVHARFQGVHANDSYGAGAFLVDQCASLIAAIESFKAEYAASLPRQAVMCLDRFLGSCDRVTDINRF